MSNQPRLSTLSQRLKATREERGVSRADLARAVKVSATAVFMWEERGVRPRDPALRAISRILDVPHRYLVEGDRPTRLLRAAEGNVAAAMERARLDIAEALSMSPHRIVLKVEVVIASEEYDAEAPLPTIELLL